MWSATPLLVSCLQGHTIYGGVGWGREVGGGICIVWNYFNVRLRTNTYTDLWLRKHDFNGVVAGGRGIDMEGSTDVRVTFMIFFSPW